jgi:hypothetical protein
VDVEKLLIPHVGVENASQNVQAEPGPFGEVQRVRHLGLIPLAGKHNGLRRPRRCFVRKVRHREVRSRSIGLAVAVPNDNSVVVAIYRSASNRCVADVASYRKYSTTTESVEGLVIVLIEQPHDAEARKKLERVKTRLIE